ncbi:hypothetical protein [Methylobacterium sp. 22177]|uniref:hypothetical protein n=1 Tax=Methylobacterium sp. 22177 TaxID=3453885 RepID=UPI003F87B4B9
MLDLMDVLTGDIIRTEATADALVEAAVALAEHQRGAEAIRDTAARTRVKAMELRGQLAALREQHATLFLSGPENRRSPGARRGE